MKLKDLLEVLGPYMTIWVDDWGGATLTFGSPGRIEHDYDDWDVYRVDTYGLSGDRLSVKITPPDDD